MKLLIVERPGGSIRALTEEHVQEIRRSAPGLDVVVTSSPSEAQKHIRDADIVAGYPATIPPVLAAKNLKWIHSFSAGVDRVLTEEVRKSDIVLSNSSGIHATPIAEHIMGFLLLWTRKFRETFEAQEHKEWNKREDLTELAGKTALIAGLGDIGLEAARLCHAFNMTVLATVRRERQKPDVVDELVTDEHMDALLPRADFVVVCLPYTSATHHRFGKQQFASMKKNAAILNIGRGSIIDEGALVEALRQKVIAGALLDVTETEPLPKESPLWEMDNVIITPHHSGFSEKYTDRAIDRFCLNLEAFLAGKPLPNLVDKEQGY